MLDVEASGVTRLPEPGGTICCARRRGIRRHPSSRPGWRPASCSTSRHRASGIGHRCRDPDDDHSDVAPIGVRARALHGCRPEPQRCQEAARHVTDPDSSVADDGGCAGSCPPHTAPVNDAVGDDGSFYATRDDDSDARAGGLRTPSATGWSPCRRSSGSAYLPAAAHVGWQAAVRRSRDPSDTPTQRALDRCIPEGTVAPTRPSPRRRRALRVGSHDVGHFVNRARAAPGASRCPAPRASPELNSLDAHAPGEPAAPDPAVTVAPRPPVDSESRRGAPGWARTGSVEPASQALPRTAYKSSHLFLEPTYRT